MMVAFVLFDRNYSGTNLPTVQIDNYLGMCMLVKHMSLLPRKNIGYVGVDLDLTPLYDRRKGFADTFLDIFGKDPLIKIVAHKDFREACVIAVEEMIKQGVDAIIFETHYLALHGVRLINDLGLNYPKDISVASFGDHEVFNIYKPRITALDLRATDIIDNTINMLFDLIDQKENQGEVTRLLEPHLLLRD